MTLYQLAKRVNENDDTPFYMKVKKNDIDRYNSKKYYVLLETHSPLGEDLPLEFDVDAVKELVGEVKELADNYDSDEHVEMWIDSRGKNGVPESIRDLLDDAETIGEMYTTLADILEKESNI